MRCRRYGAYGLSAADLTFMRWTPEIVWFQMYTFSLHSVQCVDQGKKSDLWTWRIHTKGCQESPRTFYRRLLPLGPWTQFLYLATDWWIVSETARPKRRRAKRHESMGWVMCAAQKPEFEVEAKPLRYKRVPRNYTRDPGLKRTCHTSVNEIAMQFWRTVLRHADMLERPDYQTVGCILSWNTPWTSKMNSIPQMQWWRLCVNWKHPRLKSILMLWTAQTAVG